MAVLTTILNAVQSQIIGMSLTGMTDANVLRMKVPVNRAQDLPRDNPYPCILIAPYGAEEPVDGTNESDDIKYPVLIVILAADQNEQDFELDKYFTWREQIRQKFHYKRLTGCTTVYQGEVFPQAIVEASAWFTEAKFISSLLVKFTSRELRP